MARGEVGKVGLRRRRAEPRHPAVERLEDRVGQRSRQRLRRATQGKDHVLHAVGEVGQLLEPERGRAALQRVKPARQLVEAGALRRRFLQLHQAARDAVVDLLRLVDESGEQLFEQRIHQRLSWP